MVSHSAWYALTVPHIWLLDWWWSNKTETCCHNKILIFIHCLVLKVSLKHFVLFSGINGWHKCEDWTSNSTDDTPSYWRGHGFKSHPQKLATVLGILVLFTKPAEKCHDCILNQVPLPPFYTLYTTLSSLWY
jgi:hypothetical protein